MTSLISKYLHNLLLFNIFELTYGKMAKGLLGSDR